MEGLKKEGKKSRKVTPTPHFPHSSVFHVSHTNFLMSSFAATHVYYYFFIALTSFSKVKRREVSDAALDNERRDAALVT